MMRKTLVALLAATGLVLVGCTPRPMGEVNGDADEYHAPWATTTTSASVTPTTVLDVHCQSLDC